MATTAKNRETVLGRDLLGAIARTAGRLALSSWALSVLFAVVALAIMYFGWSTDVPAYEALPVLYPVLLATVFSTVGAVVASRRPENLIGWIMCATGLLFALNALASSYAAHALYSNPEPMPGAALAAGRTCSPVTYRFYHSCCCSFRTGDRRRGAGGPSSG